MPSMPPMPPRHATAHAASRRAVLAPLALVVALASSGAAAAAGWREDDRAPRGDDGIGRFLADEDVRAVVSSTVDGVLYRAIASDHDGVPALVVETFDRVHGRNGRGRDARPNTQTFIDSFRLGDRSLAFRGLATAIDDLSLRRRTLTFSTWLAGQRDELRCTLELGAVEAQCQGGFDDYPEDPRPPIVRPPGGRPPIVQPPFTPNWAAAPDVIRACGDAFYAAENEIACLDRVRHMAFDPTSVIQACDAHAYGDEGALACLGNVAGSRVDPTATIAACDAATYGQEFFLQCVSSAQSFRFPPSATIAACDAAMYGDDATVKCVAATSRYDFEAAPTIAACDAATYGDEAALACVERGGAY